VKIYFLRQKIKMS